MIKTSRQILNTQSSFTMNFNNGDGTLQSVGFKLKPVTVLFASKLKYNLNDLKLIIAGYESNSSVLIQHALNINEQHVHIVLGLRIKIKTHLTQLLQSNFVFISAELHNVQHLELPVRLRHAFG